MVAKINRGASLYGAVIYNQQKVDDSTARIISGNRMIADVTGNPEQVMRNTLWAFENYLLANLGYASFAVEAGVAYGLAAAPADGLYFLDSIGPGHKPVTAFEEVALKVGAEAVADDRNVVFVHYISQKLHLVL